MSEDKDVVAVVDLGIALGKLVQKAVKGGKAGLADDVAAALAIYPMLSPAILGAAQVPVELKALDVDTAAALVAHVAAELTLDNPKAQAVTEKALSLAVSVYALVEAVKA